MSFFQWFLLLSDVGLAVFSAGHALLTKRDPRSALGWIAVCLMFPVAGPVMYFILGVNRIRTRARRLEQDSPFRVDRGEERNDEIMAFQIPPPLDEIVRMSDAIVRRPLICGNRVVPLINGESAYPAMMEAVEAAENYIYLTTYIFRTDTVGRRFIDALAAAGKRGVDVRVIIDGVGEYYSFPLSGNLLKKKGIRVARFLPPTLFPPTLRINLRNHRKILVADGRTGFVGGMNIDDNHLAQDTSNPKRISDLHFRLTGPIVSQIEQVFLEDWRFCVGEHIRPKTPDMPHAGKTICRAVVDGPNVQIDRLYMLLICSLSAARKRVRIMMPYFLPSAEIIAALQAAALRGVAVDILLPSKNNLPYVHWATMNILQELLEQGVRIRFQPPPFVHTKLLIIDAHYAQVGSANIDTRSFRLNFEMMIEIYDRRVAQRLMDYFDERLENSREATMADISGRSLPVRIRDAFFWLFTPYL